MTSREIKFLRGTEALNDAHTGELGTVSIDMDNWELRLHDGASSGGHVLPGIARLNSKRDKNDFELKSADFTALPFMRYGVDSSAGQVDVTLSATPQVGDTIKFFDVGGHWATNNVRLLRNTRKIEGTYSDKILSGSVKFIELTWVGTTYGWVVSG